MNYMSYVAVVVVVDVVVVVVVVVDDDVVVHDLEHDDEYVYFYMPLDDD
jgi:hypothetical protein